MYGTQGKICFINLLYMIHVRQQMYYIPWNLWNHDNHMLCCDDAEVAGGGRAVIDWSVG